MRHEKNQRRNAVGSSRTGVTRIEVSVLLAVTMVFVTLGCTRMSRSRIVARATQSKNNLAQMGKAIKHYEGLGRGNVPPANWEKAIAPYLDDPENVMICPSAEGKYGYAMYTAADRFGMGDAEKTTIVTSDDRLIDIDTKNCENGLPVVTGKPVGRYTGIVLALMYGGAVRAFEIGHQFTRI